LPLRVRQPLTVDAAVNAVWALDFMSDALWSGRRFRVLNVLDEGVREGLASVRARKVRALWPVTARGALY
jgi:putative transposase